MNRRGFLGLGAALAVAPKVVLSAPVPPAWAMAEYFDSLTRAAWEEAGINFETVTVTSSSYAEQLLAADMRMRVAFEKLSSIRFFPIGPGLYEARCTEDDTG